MEASLFASAVDVPSLAHPSGVVCSFYPVYAMNLHEPAGLLYAAHLSFVGCSPGQISVPSQRHSGRRAQLSRWRRSLPPTMNTTIPQQISMVLVQALVSERDRA